MLRDTSINPVMTNFKPFFTAAMLMAMFPKIFSQGPGVAPISPGATEVAKALHGFFHSRSGRQTLSGQHDAPLVGDMSRGEPGAFPRK
jgi:hypothetical protein